MPGRLRTPATLGRARGIKLNAAPQVMAVTQTSGNPIQSVSAAISIDAVATQTSAHPLQAANSSIGIVGEVNWQKTLALDIVYRGMPWNSYAPSGFELLTLDYAYLGAPFSVPSIRTQTSVHPSQAATVAVSAASQTPMAVYWYSGEVRPLEPKKIDKEPIKGILFAVRQKPKPTKQFAICTIENKIPGHTTAISNAAKQQAYAVQRITVLPPIAVELAEEQFNESEDELSLLLVLAL